MKQKKLLAILLIAAMLFPLLPAGAFAEDKQVVESYSVATLYSDGTLEITDNVSNLVTIPWQNERVSIKKVVFTENTPLSTRLFSDCTNLEEITLPNSITEIPLGCFNNCTSLTNITIPDSVIAIGERAFSDCGELSSVVFGENSRLKTIGIFAFNDCDVLNSIALPNGVTSIGGNAFNSCNVLVSIEIPDSAVISSGAFSGCNSLASISIPSTITSIPDNTFRGCSALTSITIPESVTSIGNYAFYGCSTLASVVIPASVTSIGDHAFSACNVLTEINYKGSAENWNVVTKGNNAIPNGVKINHTGSCVDGDINHICDICRKELTHEYSTEWKFADDNHWKECTCGAKSNVAEHSGGTATCKEKAKCDVCNQPYGTLAAHTPGEAVQENEKAASCKEAGSYDEVVYCTVAECMAELSRETKAIDKLAHNYSGGVCTVCGSSKPSSGGGFSGKYNYAVNTSADGAEIALSDDYATAGETVTITITPDMGKKVDEVIVTDADDDIIPVTKVGDNKYTFIMPQGKVNVSVITEDADYDKRIIMQIGNQNIVLNNHTITNDVPPVIVDDRTLVPVRIITELLGGTAHWDGDTRTVTLKIDGKVLKLVIDEEIPGYGTGAAIIHNRTYVPIRWIVENLNGHVTWVAATQQIVIEK